MDNTTITHRLNWYINRLRCMSAKEVFYRTKLISLGYGLQSGLLTTVAPSSDLSQPMDFYRPFHCPSVDEEKYIIEADAILAGRVRLFSHDAFYTGTSVCWNQDPLTGVISPARFGPHLPIGDQHVVGDIKYVWELNRHLHFVRLAQAFALSGDSRYMSGLTKQIRSWLQQCPPMLGPNWSSALECSLRLINWCLVWNIAGHRSLFAGQEGQKLKKDWLRSIHAHCQFISRYLSRHSSANNHLIGELAGLYIAAKTWPHWNECQAWSQQAKQELEREAVVQFHEDGVGREQAFSYQVFNLQLFFTAALFGHSSSDEFTPEFWDSMSKAVCFLKSLLNCRSQLPHVGDSDDGVVFRLEPESNALQSTLSIAEILSSDVCIAPTSGEAEWLFAVTGRPRKALLTSLKEQWCFPHGGYFLFGTQFGTDHEVKGLIDCGPLGYLGIAAHGHADALAILMSICGEPFLIDTGTYSYGQALKWRTYFRGTSAHNTVTVDRQDQSASGGRFMWTKKAKVFVDQKPTSPKSFEVTAWHDGFLRLNNPARHTRQVRFDYLNCRLTVNDSVSGTASHVVEQHWHFAPHLEITLTTEGAMVRGLSFTVHINFNHNVLEAALHKGNEDIPLGWCSLAYGSKEPTNTLVLKAVGNMVDINTQFNIELIGKSSN